MATSPSLPRGSDAVVSALAAGGVEVVFGMCGHGDLGLLDAFAASNIKFVSVHHEQVAVHAADAYFRVTGRPGVVITTLGPGMLNTATGLGDAALDSSAVLVISGSAPSRYTGLGAYQEIDEHGDDEQWLATRPLVKRSYRVTEPLGVARTVARALYDTLAGSPGPVHVHVPLDTFTTRGSFPIPPPLVPPRPALPSGLAEELATRLRNGERPVIYVGGGVVSAQGTKALVQLAEAVDAPVVTSMLAQGAIPEDHPLSLGFTGVVGTRPANYAIQRADVVLAVGTRFREMDTSSWRSDTFLSAECEVLQIDIDARQIGRHYPVAAGGVADAREALAQMAKLCENDGSTHPTWRQELGKVVAEWQTDLGALQADESLPLQPAAILSTIRGVMPRDAVMVTGVGVRHLVGQHYPVLAPGTMLVASGFSTMGWETAATLGAKAGVGGRPVLGLIGDGAFNSTVSALSTAVAYELGITWVLLDNGGYQSIGVYQDRHFGRRLATDFAYPSGKPYQIDYVALARAYGAEAESIDSIGGLRAAVQRGIDSGGNYLVHVPTTGRPRATASGHWDVNDIMAGDTDILPALLEGRN